MAKKKKKNNGKKKGSNGGAVKTGQPEKTQPSNSAGLDVKATAVKKSLQDLEIINPEKESVAIDEVVKIHKNPSTPPADKKVIEEKIKGLERLLEKVHESKGQADDIRKKASVEKKAAAEELKAAGEQRKKVDQEQANIEQEKKGLNVREKQLNERDHSIEEREAEADSGFLEKERKSFPKLRDLRKQLTDDLEKLEVELNAKRNESTEIQDESINKMRVEIDVERDKLITLKGDLFEKEEGLVLQDEELNARRKGLDKYIQDAAKERVCELEEKVGEAERHTHKLKGDNVSLRKELDDHESLRSVLGGRSPEEAVSLIEELRTKTRELSGKLDRSGGEELLERNDRVKEELVDSLDQVFQLESELKKLKMRLNSAELAQFEQESIKRTNEALGTHNEALGVAVDQLKVELDELKEKSSDRPVFGELVRLDGLPEYAKKQSVIGKNHGEGLQDFTEAVRHNMAKDGYFYSEDTIQLFLGGLAMSRLHILQGISGTGKTSLAMKFAEVVSGKDAFQKVEVQAGWRDNQDLIGYYNAFEKKYYEKDASIGLYKAGMPGLKDRPFVLLLDEMNLSHVEYYFADFLSKLEDDDKRDKDGLLKLRLATGLPSSANAPQGLTKDGQHLIIPDNVWFIGTANHDETTMEFADKTYDRSHIMTLDRHDKEFNPIDGLNSQWSFADLTTAFKDAENKHKQKVVRIREVLESEVGTELYERFGVGWGNRLERQLKSFIPVVIESGGSEGLALDHILATKLLRKGKVAGRFDIQAEDLIALKGSVEKVLTKYNVSEVDSQAIRLLKAEIKRVGGQDV